MTFRPGGIPLLRGRDRAAYLTNLQRVLQAEGVAVEAVTVVDEDTETIRVVYTVPDEAALKTFDMTEQAIVGGYTGFMLAPGWTPGPLEARGVVQGRRDGAAFRVEPEWARRHVAGEWTERELLERALETAEPWPPDGTDGGE